MGLFGKFRNWLAGKIVGADKQVVDIVELLETHITTEPVWKARKRVKEEAVAEWRAEERIGLFDKEIMPAWEAKVRKCIKEHEEKDDLTEEEMIERYDSFKERYGD